jgi:hypothetical protein
VGKVSKRIERIEKSLKFLFSSDFFGHEIIFILMVIAMDLPLAFWFC